MIITYLGKECLRLQTGDTVIAVNPPSKKSDFKVSGFGADVCLISNSHPDFNGPETVTYGEKKPFVINGPGEYESGGIFFQGFPVHGAKSIVTSYVFSFDSLRVCVVGPISDGELPQQMKEDMDGVDIAIIPIGGKTVIGSEVAYKLAKQMGAKVIIPVDFGSDQEKGALDQFLKITGSKNVVPVDKYTVKVKDILNKEGEVVVLQSI